MLNLSNHGSKFKVMAIGRQAMEGENSLDTVGESRDYQLLYSDDVEFESIIAVALTTAAHRLLRLLVCLITYAPLRHRH